MKQVLISKILLIFTIALALNSVTLSVFADSTYICPQDPVKDPSCANQGYDPTTGWDKYACKPNTPGAGLGDLTGPLSGDASFQSAQINLQNRHSITCWYNSGSIGATLSEGYIVKGKDPDSWYEGFTCEKSNPSDCVMIISPDTSK